MCSAWDNAALPALGFPIRASAGQWLFSASPRLIAAVHALRRLLVPRHPPCALNILTVIGETLTSFPSEKSSISPRQNAARRFALIPVSLATVQFSRSEKRRSPSARARDPGARERRRTSRSLKTQQHASRIAAGARPAHATCQVRSTLLGRSLEAIAAQLGSLERR
jgi:hypothetical protein